MIEFATAEAKGRGIMRVALTSNAVRRDAHRFYERLGFKPSHLGFKMALK
jgi:GNAT superfamily N-acetyltransferase